MVILVAIPSFLFLHHSRWGRYIYAVGSNAEAARLSRRPCRRVRSISPTPCRPSLAAFVGPAARQPHRHRRTPRRRGVGASVDRVLGHRRHQPVRRRRLAFTGPLLGSFLLTTINNGANLLNVNSFWQRIITGVADHRRSSSSTSSAAAGGSGPDPGVARGQPASAARRYCTAVVLSLCAYTLMTRAASRMRPRIRIFRKLSMFT